MPIKYSDGYVIANGDKLVFIPPVASEEIVGGFKAKERTNELLEVVIDSTTAKAYVGTEATVESVGLMSAEDKVKLDSIPEDAKYTDTIYTHPDTHPATMITEDEDHKFVSSNQLSKLDSIPEDAKYTDTIYTHPDTHPVNMIVEDENHKFVSTTILDKINSIPEDAKYTDTIYTHPEAHAATMITQDSTHRFVSDEEKSAWNSKASTSIATTTTDGLMSAEDKVKLEKCVSDIEEVIRSYMEDEAIIETRLMDILG